MRRFEGPVPVEQAVDWGRQLATALAYLHSHGIVHRDLKPENVLVTTDGRLKIADFGTAMITGARRLTWKHLSESLGTPDYMSPEQVQGERGDARSDVYAWGVLMYELLTGRVPFEGDNWLAVMAGHLQGTPVALTARRRSVPAGLDAIVRHALRRSPDHRYQSADDLLADLDRYETLRADTYDLSPEPGIGGMAAAGTQRRLWAFVGAIAGGFLLLVAVLIGLTLLLK
jgi:serine/threonine-protein kinase